MQTPCLTLYNRIEPRTKITAAKGDPNEKVSAMAFVGDLAVFWATISEQGDREARVIFQGIMYRFADVPENREAISMYLGKLGGLG